MIKFIILLSFLYILYSKCATLTVCFNDCGLFTEQAPMKFNPLLMYDVFQNDFCPFILNNEQLCAHKLHIPFFPQIVLDLCIWGWNCYSHVIHSVRAIDDLIFGCIN